MHVCLKKLEKSAHRTWLYSLSAKVNRGITSQQKKWLHLKSNLDFLLWSVILSMNNLLKGSFQLLNGNQMLDIQTWVNYDTGA